MPTTYTLTKVEPVLGGDARVLPGTDQQNQGKIYRYECQDNSNPAKTIVILSPDTGLLTAGNDGKSGTNTGSIVITDTPG